MELIQLFDQLSIRIKNYNSISGGDINQTYYLEAEEGRFFIKVNDSQKHPYMFQKEADGLNSLVKANGIYVPKIIEVGEFNNLQYLLLEWIEEGRPNKDIWREFGSSLAEMHKTPKPYFGFKEDNYIGSLKQINTLSNTWQELYGEYHILPLMKMLIDQNKCSDREVLQAENFIKKINEIFPEELPSIVHGDLWSGNYIISEKGKAVLIDPAVYYGHREMDIGMTKLFGGFHSLFYQAYNEVYPLENGWEKRLPYTQLYPLLVHAILFGGYYVKEVKNILNEF